MRSRLITVLLLVVSSAHASGPGYGPQVWGWWDIETQPGYCNLKIDHKAVQPPYYPDLFISFRVSVKWKDGRPTGSNVGKLMVYIQTYLPNVPKEHQPLHRIVAIKFNGMQLQQVEMPEHDDILRGFTLSAEDAEGVLSAFRNAEPYGTVELELQLQNGEVVMKHVPAHHYFDTKARMLLVCTSEGISH